MKDSNEDKLTTYPNKAPTIKSPTFCVKPIRKVLMMVSIIHAEDVTCGRCDTDGSNGRGALPDRDTRNDWAESLQFR